MRKSLDSIVRFVVSAVSSFSKGSTTDPKGVAYLDFKNRITAILGKDHNVLEVLKLLENIPDYPVMDIVLKGQLSNLEITQYSRIDEAFQKVLKTGDDIQVDSDGDVAFSKDHGMSVILKYIINIDSPNSKNLLELYLKDMAAETNYLPWASVDKDYADPSQGENLELIKIYTALDTTALEKLDSEDGVRQYLHRQKEIRRISAQEMIDTHSKLVLLGDPGSGKSTFINYLAHIMAMAGIENSETWLDQLKKNGPWSHGVMLPIRMMLKDFAALFSKKIRAGSVKQVFDYLQSTLKTAAFWPILHEILLDDKKPCLILLDGLDEVPTDQREAVVRTIDTFAAKYKWHRYLVTCRIYAYIGKDYQLKGFRPATLTPFNHDQIEGFISTWYRELYKLKRFTESESKIRSEKLKTAATRPDLIGLAERPLLITVMAMLHANRGELPENRVELYQWTVDLLMRRWESRHGGHKGILESLDIPGLKMSDLEAGLHKVAFEIHGDELNKGDTGEINEGNLRQQLAPYLNNKWDKAGVFVDYVRDRAGLLIRHKPDAYTFPHRTFQEFMAACYLVAMGDYPSEAAKRVSENPDRWRIVFILAAGYATRTHRLSMAISSVSALCSQGTGENGSACTQAHHLAVIAGEALLEIGLVGVQLDTYGRDMLNRTRQWLLSAMNADDELTAIKRVEAGNILSQLGDPRFNPKKWFLPNGDNLGFVTIPAGPFKMGSDKARDSKARDNEVPQHTVMLSEYAIGKYPVTVAQYRVFAEETGHELDNDWQQYNRYDNHPIVVVSWHDAMAYCEWVTGKLNADRIGGVITLPTEAQWEKAARGDAGRIYPWGDDEINPNRANYDKTGINMPSSVGCFLGGKSSYELFDMSGNVWEWCRDRYDENYYSKSREKDPTGPDNGALRVLRGGSWSITAMSCRAAFRVRYDPGGRISYGGFRLVCLPGHIDGARSTPRPFRSYWSCRLR